MKRILTAVVVIPLFIVVTTTPAHAVFRIDPSRHPAGHDDLQSGHSNLQGYDGQNYF